MEIYSVSEICVVHLVRKNNGIDPFRGFLESYLEYPAGADHELLILYKGFSSDFDVAPYEELLKSTPHTFLIVSDFGFDLGSYFIAAEKCNSKYFCFLNSFCVILDKNWLLKLYHHISEPGVGLVGTTGSWGSLCPRKKPYNKNMHYMVKLVRSLTLPVLRPLIGAYFDYFPNYHIRTNGFMIARDIMLRITRAILFTKLQAFYLESGKKSITNQILKMGLKPIVVGKDGRGYEKHEWDISNTFWRGSQENLLISDNQTRKYDSGASDWKEKWEFFAWGSIVSKSLDR